MMLRFGCVCVKSYVRFVVDECGCVGGVCD